MNILKKIMHKEPHIERQEIYCHDCGNYVQFDLDINMNGNHVLNCPVCNHEHCRVVDNGVITDRRWDSRNRDDSYYVISSSSITYSSTSTYSRYSGGSSMYDSWLNTTTSSTSTGYL